MKSSNFGDGVNNKFWRKIIQKDIKFNKDEEHYITTGSIMCQVNKNSIILGSGFISDKADLGGRKFKSQANKKYVIPKKVISVRGPLSRKKMIDFGIDCPENYGDPLILMPCIYRKQKKIEENIVGIIPHYIDKNNNNIFKIKEELEKNKYKVKIIDICVGRRYNKLINEINECKYIISSSLHGVIMGIVYKKKTIYTKVSNKVIGGSFKFQDFFKSININYEYKKDFSKEILNNTINVDYENLVKVGKNFISIIPFIDENRKKELIKIYSEFYNN